MILAYLLLLTGLTISTVAIYYSVVGLTAIFSAAAVPIMVMGISLELAKLVCATWIKANWTRVPALMRTYMCIAVVVLMLITSMGIFGFLSKAHNDQNLVSGDVQAKLEIVDEKINTAKDNIEADRKQLKQMDEAVDQIMGRSTDEKGADKSNAVRKSQQRDRLALAKDIEANQKIIAQLNDEAAPIRAEVRKVDAEVGPIKYIAAFIYGTTPDASMLERAVTWIIIMIVVVFDPLAVIMLLASQMTFAWQKEEKDEGEEFSIRDLDTFVGEKPTAEELTEDHIKPEVFGPEEYVVPIEDINAMLDEAREPPPETELLEISILEQHPYLNTPFSHFKNLTPMVLPIVNEPEPAPVVEEPVIESDKPLIKALEGQEAYELMKSIGIFTEDGKLAPEYGGEEEVEDNSVNEEVIDFETQDPSTATGTEVDSLPEYENLNAPGLDASVERPGDYVTPPVEPARVLEAAPARGRGIMHSHLLADNEVELGKASRSDFGNNFPVSAEKGDVYLRTDYLPNRLFKFNGAKWIEVDKSQTDVYAYDEMYIKHLIEEIAAGRYDADSLTDSERDNIAEYLRNNPQ